MAVLKYKNDNGEFTELVVPVNVISGGSGSNVVLPDIYYNYGDGYDRIQYDVSNYNTITFNYEFTQDSVTAQSRVAATILIKYDCSYYCRLGSFNESQANNYKYEYVLSSFKDNDGVKGTFTIDVKDYSTIVIVVYLSSLSGYHTGGCISLNNFITA